MTAAELLEYLDELLSPELYNDYCPNGWQVEGGRLIGNLVTGVTACQGLLDAAIEADADAILVHHGYFWKGEDPAVVGMKQRRLKTLLQHGIHLLAYHLPLDGHPEFGNNAQLARHLDLHIEGRFIMAGKAEIGLYGRLSRPLPAETFALQIAARLGRIPLHIAGHQRPIERLGWCSGAAQGYIDEAAALGLDAYLSGEVSEHTTHSARELGIDYFGCGHHATERYGVQALGEHLASRFGLEHHFIDIDNPV